MSHSLHREPLWPFDVWQSDVSGRRESSLASALHTRGGSHPQSDYHPAVRVMERVTIVGDRPA